MGKAESAPEELSPMIAFNRQMAGTEADMAVIAAGAIGSADVDIEIDIDEEKIYPSDKVHIAIKRPREQDDEAVGVVFSYARNGLGAGSLAKARLQQTVVHQEEGFGDVHHVVNDFITVAPDKSLVRHKEIRTKAPGFTVQEQDIIKRASSRTVVAMARLAAFHARTGHESSRST